MPDKYETFRVLALQLNDAIDIHSHEGIKMLFKTVQCLLLGKVDGIQNVVNELNIDGFPDLKHLYVVNNSNIKYVSATKLSNCVDIFPNLESLCLYNLVNLKMICYGLVTIASFAKLKAIKIEMCNRLENLYSFYSIKFPTGSKTCEISECNYFMDKFPTNVEVIEVCECESLKEILQIPVDYEFEFLKLKTLTLQSLPSLRCFYTEVDGRSHLTEVQTANVNNIEITSEEDEQNNNTPRLFGELVAIPNLESLNISSLNVYRIWSDKHLSSFWGQNLIKLVVKDCNKLTYLCSLSTASYLKRLKSLVISGCLIMERIFETKENNADKVCVFPKLEEIHLSKMNRLTDIWQTEVSVDSFSNIISVNIEECNKLDKIFPSHMKGWLECLDNLKVCGCQSMEVIFEINDYKEIEEFGGIDTNLQVIFLENLPKLKQLWSTDPYGILNFKKLRTIDIHGCYKLRNVFPVAVAKYVPKLERISILHCYKMVEIFGSQDVSDAKNDQLVFLELTCVRLYGLLMLKHFYKGKHPIKCPKLKELSINVCGKLKLFLDETNEITNTEETCVFSAEEVLPNVEYMEIYSKKAQNLLLKYQMHRLKELSLEVISVDLLYQFPYSMSNLEKLKMTCISSSEELEPRAKQERSEIALQLKELVLISSNVKDLGLGRAPVLHRLELLSLKFCHGMENLGPPSVSLTYLTYLELNNCWNLRNLMAPSTAQSMVQLKTMKVIKCSNLEVIVRNEGSEEGKPMKIVFNKLISVELVGLEIMRSFCRSKECEFEFPSLEILIVRECPEMQKFTERRSITPKLKNVFGVEGDEKATWQWEDNLNSTIQKVFNDKVSFAYSEDVWLVYETEFIVKNIWCDTHSVHQNSFQSLRRLTVWRCTRPEVIPSHLFSCFPNLEELNVSYCREARVIFNIDANSVRKASGIFRLKKLSLMDLSNLKHVWDKDPEGIIGLKVLKEMEVSRCENLKGLFPASVAKDLTRLEVLRVTECKELAEIFNKDEKGGEGEGEGTTQELVFPRLTTLTLEQLPCLKYSIHTSKQQVSLRNLSIRYSPLQEELSLGSQLISNSSFGLLDSLTVDGCHFSSDVLLPVNLLRFLNNLEELAVGNCNFVKTIFGVKCTTQDTITFPLKKLTLYDLPNLENVWNEDPRGVLNMNHLQEVNVKQCRVLTNVFPASIAQDLLELKNLEVEDCEELMTIVAEDDTDPRGTNQELPCPFVRSLQLQGLPMFKYFYYCSLKCDNYAHLKSHTENQVYVEKLFRCLSMGKNGVEMILHGKFQRSPLHIEKLVLCDGSFNEIFKCQSPNNVDYSELLLRLKELQLESLRGSVSIELENSWIGPFVGNLETLKVISCGSLENLVPCKVSFSNLRYLEVQSCDRLSSYLFTSSTAKSLSQLIKMKIKRCKSIKEIVSKEEEEESDENEIIFSKLRSLTLKGLQNLKRFYCGSLSFPSLEELSITNCDKMLTLCTGTLKTYRLSQVTLDGSEVLLQLETNLNSTMQKEFLKEISELEELDLRCKPKLGYIWKGSLHIPELCFTELAKLTVKDCQFLSDAVLPFYLLPLLPNLETLEVRNCDSVKTIFDVKCRTQDTLITFPLKKLVLCDLPNLETVWNEDPHGILSMKLLEKVHVGICNTLPSVFPASVAKDLVKLEDLVVEKCERLMVIVAEDNITDPRGTNVEITFPCPCVRSLKLLDLPKFKYFYYCALKSDINTNMESHPEDQLDDEKCLLLGGNGMKMILGEEFQRLLDNLKVLILRFHSNAFGYETLEQVPNIEKLVLCDGSFKEIFCCESPNNVDYYSRVLLHLKVLHLKYLENIFSIELNLAAWRLPLSNLTCLKVEGCRSLSYLLTSSTAKRLDQLKRMEIKDCESIEEIVCKEESDEDEIIFPKLICLNLECLSKLKSFYRGRLSFPSLEKLSVTDCNHMVTLCSGTLKTAKLFEVNFETFPNPIPLEIDLNHTMRKEFLIQWEEKESLEFRDRADLQEIWCLALQIPDFCFSYLKKLIVNECKISSDAVLPFTLLPLLPKLETLEVRNCHSLKAIFDVQCKTQDTLITFPLKKLVLSELPNLETVWNEDPHGILSMQFLQQVFVDNCKCLTSVFPASQVKNLEKLENLVVKDCEGLITIVGEANTNQDKEIIFEGLQVLDLRRLQKLKCFCSGNFTLSFPYLMEVHVIKCSSMKTFSISSKIYHSTKWYYAEDASPRQETDLNSAVRRTYEEEAPDASSAIISVLQ